MPPATTTLQARAEQNLLKSLSKPRSSKNKTGFGNQFSKTSTLATTNFFSNDDSALGDEYSRSGNDAQLNSTGGDPFSKTKVDLKMAAKQKRALRIREQNKEIDEVAILASDPAKEAVKHKFKRIEVPSERAVRTPAGGPVDLRTPRRVHHLMT